VLDARAARATAQILEDVVRRGTASSARALGLRKRAAGKTGTTNDFVDAWFVGFTRSLTCGVWVGFDQPKTIMPGAYGADLALPIWVDFMQAADAGNYPD
jgi:penicillin-binding protein 1A